MIPYDKGNLTVASCVGKRYEKGIPEHLLPSIVREPDQTIDGERKSDANGPHRLYPCIVVTFRFKVCQVGS